MNAEKYKSARISSHCSSTKEQNMIKLYFTHSSCLHKYYLIRFEDGFDMGVSFSGNIGTTRQDII